VEKLPFEVFFILIKMAEIKEKNKEVWWQPALVIGGEITGWIVGPLILALFLGDWLDKKYASAPKFLLISVGIAFVISNVGIITNTIKAAKKIEKDKNNDNQRKSDN